jgi:hypothetical protein
LTLHASACIVGGVSFSVAVSSVDTYGVRAAVLAEFEAGLQRDRDANGGVHSPAVAETVAEVRDMVEAGIRSAESLVRAVADGRPDWSVDVSISGHANPGGQPRDGWSNDFLSVSVSNASLQPAARRARDEAVEAERLSAVREMAALSSDVGPEEAKRLLEAAAALADAEVPAEPVVDEDLALASYGDVGGDGVDDSSDVAPLAAPAGDSVIAELD